MKRYDIFLISLAVGLLFSVAVCCVQASEQQTLSEKIVRLHVLANSDSDEDQELKLKVRDAVLSCSLDGRPDDNALRVMEEAAAECIAQNGYDYPVAVSFEHIYFDTRVYDGFALPAGYYDAVRVVIGQGEGHNWWCVVYPALCNDLAEGEELLSDEELSYITLDGEKYVVRFKLQELISRWADEMF